MAGIAPEKANPVKPGDRWITKNDAGQYVERVRNEAGDSWDEFPIDQDMPHTLMDAHRVILELHTQLAQLRRQVKPTEPAQSVFIGERPAKTVTPTKKPCGGCGK